MSFIFPTLPRPATVARPLVGWLRLFVACAWLAVARQALMLVGIAATIVDGRHAARTTPGGALFDELWEPLIQLAALSQSALLVIGLLMLSFIVLRRAEVCNYAIAWLLLDALFGVTLYLLSHQIPAVAATPDTVGAVAAALSVLPLAWIPYLAFSKRVRETFVT